MIPIKFLQHLYFAENYCLWTTVLNLHDCRSSFVEIILQKTEDSTIPITSVVVLEESPCCRGSLRTNFQVLVLESQVLDNNTVSYHAEQS